ncbi:MAG: 30S ribosomal protein S7 [Candidatus Melainabacteria bacterium RIFCSPLOWO2_02_FULL_35_15]|nr:MAG: 30S ribosomal protein S7 [Candidatus Melainabacteria bacterium RIFCSPLOWO2_12_FULL_35_11]OGI13571.1 MAG: 30S ribosomal protein S7 [Candidatus Melainabacteria bacterium RIFCSPLOWO2_02_FULL_35_15]
MPRKGRADKRIVEPDTRFKSTNIQRFINRIMQRGKKSTAQKIVYSTFDLIKEKINQDPAVVFKKAIKNVSPVVKVKARRIGGSTYQVPIEVGQFEGESLGSRWLILSARKRSGKSMTEKLAAEFIDAANGQGTAVKKREDTHKMAEANKAFAHYRY